MEAVQTCASTQ